MSRIYTQYMFRNKNGTSAFQFNKEINNIKTGLTSIDCTQVAAGFANASTFVAGALGKTTPFPAWPTTGTTGSPGPHEIFTAWKGTPFCIQRKTKVVDRNVDFYAAEITISPGVLIVRGSINALFSQAFANAGTGGKDGTPKYLQLFVAINDKVVYQCRGENDGTSITYAAAALVGGSTARIRVYGQIPEVAPNEPYKFRTGNDVPYVCFSGNTIVIRNITA